MRGSGGVISAEPVANDPLAVTAAAGVSSVAAIRGVLGVTPFRRLWYATALSSLGDWLGLLATTALATSLAHGYQAQNYALGGVLVVKLLPAIVLGPLAGAFVDRFDRRRTMVVSDLIRFALFLTIPIVHTIAWLLIASFLIECVSLFWMPAKDASVPNLVRRDQVEAANQLSLITTYGITPILGAALFSVLSLITSVLARHLSFFRAQPVNLALYFNAATFLFGALVVYFIKEIGGRRGARIEQDQPGLFALLREGAVFVRSSRLVGGIIIGLVGAFVAGRRGHRRGQDLRRQPGRRQRVLRCAVRRGVRRSRRRYGVRPAHRSGMSRSGGCSGCRSSSPRSASCSPRSCRSSRWRSSSWSASASAPASATCPA